MLQLYEHSISLWSQKPTFSNRPKNRKVKNNFSHILAIEKISQVVHFLIAGHISSISISVSGEGGGGLHYDTWGYNIITSTPSCVGTLSCSSFFLYMYIHLTVMHTPTNKTTIIMIATIVTMITISMLPSGIPPWGDRGGISCRKNWTCKYRVSGRSSGNNCRRSWTCEYKGSGSWTHHLANCTKLT